MYYAFVGRATVRVLDAIWPEAGQESETRTEHLFSKRETTVLSGVWNCKQCGTTKRLQTHHKRLVARLYG